MAEGNFLFREAYKLSNTTPLPQQRSLADVANELHERREKKRKKQALSERGKVSLAIIRRQQE